MKESKYSKGWCIRMVIMMILVFVGMMYGCVTYCLDSGAFAALINLF